MLLEFWSVTVQLSWGPCLPLLLEMTLASLPLVPPQVLRWPRARLTGLSVCLSSPMSLRLPLWLLRESCRDL